MDSTVEIDATGFRPEEETANASSNAQEGPNPFSTKYNMNHAKRGSAVIFNHMYFDMHQCPTRLGTNKDRDNLTHTMQKLGFNVRSFNDLTKEKVRNTLISVAMEDHSNEDCIAIIVLSHGDKGIIYAKDNYYRTELLWTYFDGKHCPTLIGKPKLFFIQACRGENVDTGVRMKTSTETDSEPTNVDQFYIVPVMADLLIMYSTVEDFLSWRNPNYGSYFIQSLVRQLKAHNNKKDLLSILTYVNREVAIGYSEEMKESGDSKYVHKQMTSIVSMLTREIYF